MYSKENGTSARRHGQIKKRLPSADNSQRVNDYHQITQAYADQFFDFLEPLKADRNFRDLVERNQHLYSRTDMRVQQLKGAIVLHDAKKVCQAAQELFDTMGRIGDVRMMRVCYRILMQSRSGNLDGAKKCVDDLEAE